jgi:hypothetical protein
MVMIIKVSKPGYDVKEENNPNNLILDSTLNHLKTSSYGSFQQSINNASNYTKTIAHGLGYRPMALVYWRNTANSRWFIASADPEETIGRYSISANCSLYVNTTNVYIKLWNYTGGTATFEVMYEIFYEGNS